jgi:hypothetical protein
MGIAIPEVMVTDKADCLSVRCPDRERCSDKSAICFALYMRTKYFPKSFVATFRDEMKVEFA